MKIDKEKLRKQLILLFLVWTEAKTISVHPSTRMMIIGEYMIMRVPDRWEFDFDFGYTITREECEDEIFKVKNRLAK